MISNLRTKFTTNSWILWLGFLGLLLAIGLTSGILIFWKGLGITNLTDLVPWGLWITIDLSSIALSAGAFSLCAALGDSGYSDELPPQAWWVRQCTTDLCQGACKIDPLWALKNNPPLHV